MLGFNPLARGTPELAKEVKLLANQAFQYLDYALYQYPFYAHDWETQPVRTALQEVVHYLHGLSPDQAPAAAFAEPLNSHPQQYLSWIDWRINSYTEESSLQGLVKEWGEIYEALRIGRKRFSQLLGEREQLAFSERLSLRWQYLHLGQFLFEAWRVAQAQLPTALQTIKLTFGERWVVDVYAELALLTTRLLAEGEAYEWAVQVAHETLDRLGAWYERWWSKEHSDSFSPRVFRCQYATLYAWQAYAGWQIKTHLETRARLRVAPENLYAQQYLRLSDIEQIRAIEELVNKAILYMPMNPLALFVNAQLLLERQRFRQAADEIQRVIQLMAPFDLHQRVAIAEAPLQGNNAYEQEAREGHPFYERVSGRRHFDGVLFEARLQGVLADIFAQMNELELSLHHTFTALSRSPYKDLHAQNLLRLAHRLQVLDRFAEALLVVDDAWAHHANLSPLDLVLTGCQEPLVRKCILNTRLANFQDALSAANTLHQQSTVSSLLKQHLTWSNVVLGYLPSRFQLTSDEISLAPLVAANFNLTLTDHQFTQAALTGYQAQVRQVLDVCNDSRQDWHQLLPLARVRLDEQHFSKALPKAEPPTNFFRAEMVIISQLWSVFGKDVLDWLTFHIELHNNLAFNRAELNFQLDLANDEIRDAIEMLEALQKASDPRHAANFDRYLVQCYDTAAWIYYRQVTPPDHLQIAETILREKALPLNQNAVIVDYHLARIHLRQLEKIWQRFNDLEQAHGPTAQAEGINLHLSSARRHLENAQHLDRNKRFERELNQLQQKLKKYRDNWEHIQLTYLERLRKPADETKRWARPE